MNVRKNFQKTISLILIFVLFLTPAVVFAQTVDTTSIPRAIPVNENTLSQESVDAQIQNSILATPVPTTSTNTGVTSSAISKTTGGVASCLGSQIVSEAISKAISQAAAGAISTVTDSILNVPTAESGIVKTNITSQVSARVGTVLGSFAGIGSISLPSWDSMAYCIVNSMIIYIANSTLEWINTGFEGNPAFLTNPDQFFVDLANQEKRAFIQNLAYGVDSGVCDVFKGTIVSSILSRYGKNQQNYYGQQGYEDGGYGYNQGQNNFNGCAFDQNPGQFNAFLGGDFTEGGGWNSWFQLTQNPSNNPYDTYFTTNDRLYSQVEAIKLSKTTELNWNNGYLSFKKCENGEKDTSKCSVTTPGSVIQNRLESSLNLGTNRLVLADKFDQVVTALVDQLITTAIDKTLETVNNN